MKCHQFLFLLVAIVWTLTLIDCSPSPQQEHITIGPEDENPALAGEPIDDNDSGVILKLGNCETMMRRLKQAMADKETHCSMMPVKPEGAANMPGEASVPGQANMPGQAASMPGQADMTGQGNVPAKPPRFQVIINP